MKTCNRCFKSDVSFHIVNRRSHGKGPVYKYEMPTCKLCIQAIDRKRSREVAKDPVRHANRKLSMAQRRFKNVYKLPLEYKEELFLKQGGKCAICKRNDKELVTDHCHSSGNVRSLLCRSCNLMIGYSQEDIEILLAGIEYLKEYKSSTSARHAA